MDIFAAHFIYIGLTFFAGMVTGWSTYFGYTRLRNKMKNRFSEMTNSNKETFV